MEITKEQMKKLIYLAIFLISIQIVLAATYTCDDTDEKDIYTRGQITADYVDDTTEKTDVCLSETLIKEYFCPQDSCDSLDLDCDLYDQEISTCPTGFECSDGACVNSGPSCTTEADCNDGNLCTIDTCNTQCLFTKKVCPELQYCDGLTGECVAGICGKEDTICCSTAPICDFGLECTDKKCVPAEVPYLLIAGISGGLILIGIGGYILTKKKGGKNV